VQPTYQALAAGVQASPVVALDETGWRVGGARAWLWAFVGAQVTVYRRMAQGRGFKDAAAILGEGDAGVLDRDGRAPTAAFAHASQQGHDPIELLARLLGAPGPVVADLAVPG
jgi:hypothetical protein